MHADFAAARALLVAALAAVGTRLEVDAQPVEAVDSVAHVQLAEVDGLVVDAVVAAIYDHPHSTDQDHVAEAAAADTISLLVQLERSVEVGRSSVGVDRGLVGVDRSLVAAGRGLVEADRILDLGSRVSLAVAAVDHDEDCHSGFRLSDFPSDCHWDYSVLMGRMAALAKAIDQIHLHRHMHCLHSRSLTLGCIAEEVEVASVLLDPVEVDLDALFSLVEVAAEAVAVRKDYNSVAAVDGRVEETSRSHTARLGPDIGGSSSPREMRVTNE